MKSDDQYKKTLRKIRYGSADAKEKKQAYYEDKVSFPANVKHSFIRGGDVLVVHDVPITKVGIQVYHDDAGRPQIHFKTPEAVSTIKSDFSPLAYTHPMKGSQAHHFRDMTDEEVKDWMIGWTSDGYFDEASGKRYADLYFDVAKLKEDARGVELLGRVTKGMSTDVSIGFFVETIAERGEFNGKAYDVKQTLIDYDHTAVLVDQQGRYSHPDGIGIGADSEINGGESMSDKNEAGHAAADALAGKLADAEKARQESDAKAREAQAAKEKAEADFKTLADKVAKAEADAHIRRVDVFVERLKGKALDKNSKLEDWKTFLATLSGSQMDFVEKTLSDVQILRDNRVAITPGAGNNSAQASDKKDYLQVARDSAHARWCAQNGIAAPVKA